MSLMQTLKQAYCRIGIHGAPPGTLLFRIHRIVESFYMRAMRHGLVSPWQGSGSRIVQSVTNVDEIPSDVVVAFRLTGGIGDYLVAARYIRDLLRVAGDFRFDVYSSQPSVAAWVFSEFPQCNNCYDEYFSWDRKFTRYPIAMYLTMFAFVYKDTLKPTHVPARNIKLLDICEKLERFRPSIEPFILYHPRMDAFLGRKAVFMGAQRHNFVHVMSGMPYGGDELRVKMDDKALAKYNLENQPYITVHNGFNTLQKDWVGKGRRATKCYPHYNALVMQLRARFPELKVVQLGTADTSEAITGVDYNLISRTTLAECATILSHSLLHIDNEGGFVHLAACLDVKSCVIFGPTDAEFFSYEDNINVAPKFCGGCWWVTEDWLGQCPRGYETPRCLSEQPPEAIAELLTPELTKALNNYAPGLFDTPVVEKIIAFKSA